MTSDPVEVAEVAKPHTAADSKEISVQRQRSSSHSIEEIPASKEIAVGQTTPMEDDLDSEKIYPTDEDLQTLRRVAGKIPWTTYTVAFVELCERFSYYGTTAVFVNFIQRPLPDGSSTGAGGDAGVPGALGMGQQASTGLTLCMSPFDTRFYVLVPR